jgi:glutathione S-transferase
MILIGQYDSPFVRRVAVALRHYRITYEHRPWSVWADRDKLAQFNPLCRVPTLVLDDGSILVDSAAILDMLDDLVGHERALIAPAGTARRDVLRVCALATGVADKSVSLFYEPMLRDAPSAVWMERCRAQITGALALLEGERAPTSGRFWFHDRLSHADIAVTCMLRFTREAHPKLLGTGTFPALDAHAAHFEAEPEFQAVVQPLTVTL